MATYNDYPQSATNNAKKALRWKKEHKDEVEVSNAPWGDRKKKDNG